MISIHNSLIIFGHSFVFFLSSAIVGLGLPALAEQPEVQAIDFEAFRINDESIDYITALNHHFSQGIDLDRNVVPKLLAEIAPINDDPEFGRQMWELLRVDPPEEPGRWLSWPAYCEQQGIEPELIDSKTPTDEEGSWELRPWSREAYPEMAAWLEHVNPSLDAIAEALRGSEYWMPLVGDADTPVNAVRLPHLPVSRHLARSYRYRIGLALTEGRVEDAIDDLGTMRRIGFFLREEPLALSQLVGLSIYRMSQGCIPALCVPGRMSIEQALRLDVTIQATQAVTGRMCVAYDTGERAMALSAFDFLLRSDEWKGLYFHGEQLSEEGAANLLPAYHRAFNHPGFDVGLARERINSNFDDVLEIASVPEYELFQAKRGVYVELLDLLRRDSIRMLIAGSEDALKPMDEAQARSYTLSVTYSYLLIVLPTFAEARTEWIVGAYDRVCQLAVQATIYRLKRGELPESIDQLGVEGCQDPFAPEQSLIYRQDADGVLIYSIGPNRQDDGGKDDPKSGDLVVRLRPR